MGDQAKIAKPKGQASKPAAHVQRKERSKGMRAESSSSTMSFLNGIKGGAVQAKVKVGPANDKYEVEADQMADKVMRMSEPGVQRKSESLSSTGVGSNGILQRMESESEENETPVIQKKELSKLSSAGDSPIQAKEATSTGTESSLRDRISRMPKARPSAPIHRINRKEEDEEIQRKSGSEVNKGPPVGGTFSTKLNQSKGSGQPMDNSTNSFMSSRFGANFRGVRIHTGGNAQKMSDSINAKAFTHRNDIYFNKGQYQPETISGKTLLAHELTHTIQQGAVGGSVQPKLKLGSPDDKYEREADTMAAKVMRKPMTSVQRKCASCEEETVQRSSQTLSRGPPEIQRKAWEKEYNPEEETIQRKTQTNPVRGPTTGIIQRDLLDDIGGALSGAADFVGDSLESGIEWIKEELNDMAEDVTGFELLTVVLAKNPITGRDVTRNGRNFMDAGLQVIPNGEEYKRKMQEDGGYEDAIAWIDEQMELLDFTVWDVLEDFGDFIDDLGMSDITSPGAALDRGLRVFGQYIDRLFTFAENVATKLLEIVKGLAINALLEWIREQTPWYPLLTVALGEDPITEEPVERNGMNILTGFIMLHPEGEAQLAQMEESGSLERAATWVDEAIIRVTRIAEGLANGFTTAWDEFTITDLLTPVDTFMEIYELFSTPVSELIDFAIEVALMILQFIKDALIARLVEYARTIPGYSLITVMLGKEIFSEEPVERTPKNIIKGFMELVPGGAEKFQELDQTGAIDDALAWIEGAIEELDLTWDAVVLIFTTAWNEFSLADLATPIETFGRVMDLFAAPVYRVIRFVAKVVIKLVEIALRIMGFPFELIGSIIERAQTAYEEIKRDPIQFLRNVLKAVKQGFVQFFNNILTHLLNGVGEWLFGQLGDAGITIPEDFSFQSILKLVFEILGITRESIFAKLREKVGEERWAQIEGAIDTLTGVWDFVNDVLTRGPIAIWEKIQEQLSGLWDMVISAARNWIMTRIIQQVTVKLLSFLDPTGIMAIVNSFIAFFNAVQSAIEYMIPMLEMLNSFLGGVIQIAQGNIQPAADLLERTMAQGMPILIGFLANQVGLGGIGRRIGEVIQSLQQRVDEGIQWMIDRAWEMGQQMINGLLGRSPGDTAESGEIKEEAKTEIDRQLADSENLDSIETVVDRVFQQLRPRGLTRLYIRDGANGEKEIIAEASPPRTLFRLVYTSLGETARLANVRTAVTITLDPLAQGQTASDLEQAQAVTRTTYEGNQQQHLDRELPGVTSSQVPDQNGTPIGTPHVISSRTNRRPGSGPDFVNIDPVLPPEHRNQGGSRGSSGGALFLTDPSRPNVVELMTYNTTGYDPESGDNASHAERQFMNWYERQDPLWKARVNKIELANNPHSPCDHCSGDLNRFRQAANNFRPDGSPPIEASISWVNVYRGTTSAGLSVLSPGWRLFGPRPAGTLDRGASMNPSRQPGSSSGALHNNEARIDDDDLVARPARYEILPQSFVQRKAKDDTSNDPLEEQADRMAEKVVETTDQEEVQRKCKACEEESVQRACKNCNEEETIQRTLSGESGGSSLSRGFQGQLNSSKGRGAPMDTNTRSFMESRFGTDFSGVSIHTGQKASSLNDQIGARAFTKGSDIYFNSGEYNPGTTEGKKLLAHELTHTIQQGAVREESVMRETKGAKPNPDQAVINVMTALAAKAEKAGGYTEKATTKNARIALNSIKRVLTAVTVDASPNSGYWILKVDGIKGKSFNIKMSVQPRWNHGKARTIKVMEGLDAKSRNEAGIQAALEKIKTSYEYLSLTTEKKDTKTKREKPGWRVKGKMGKIDRVVTEVDDLTNLKTGNSIKEAIPIKWYKPVSKYPKSVTLSNRRPGQQVQGIGSKKKLSYQGRTKKHKVDIGVRKSGRSFVGSGSNPYLVSTGDVLKRAKSRRTGSAQVQYRSALTKCGYNWTGKDADHVVDLGFGGADKTYNLWPLDSKINRRAYQDRYYLSYRVVRKVDSNSSELKSISSLYGKYFKITGEFGSMPTKYPLGGLVQRKLKDEETKNLIQPKRKRRRKRAPRKNKDPQVLTGCEPKDERTRQKQDKEAKGGEKKTYRSRIREFRDKIATKVRAFKKKLINTFSEAKRKFLKVIKRKGRKSYRWGRGLMGALAGAAFKIIKVIMGIMARNIFQLISNSFQTGIDNYLTKLKGKITGEADVLAAKFNKLQDLYFSLRDKFTKTAEFLSEKLIAPFRKLFKKFSKLKKIVEKIGSLVNAARWIYRILACVSPPIIGCLWILGEALASWLLEKIIASCKFQKRIAPAVAGLGIVKSIQHEIASFTVDKLKGHIPKELRSLFPAVPKNSSVNISGKLTCSKNVTKEQEEMGKLLDAIGPDKLEAVMKIWQKSGLPKNTPISSPSAQQIIKMVKDSGLSAADLMKYAKNYRLDPNNDKIKALDAALKQMKNQKPPKKTGVKKAPKVTKAGKATLFGLKKELEQLSIWFDLNKNGSIRIKRSVQKRLRAKSFHRKFANGVIVTFDRRSKVKLVGQKLKIDNKRENVQIARIRLKGVVSDVPLAVTGIKAGDPFSWSHQFVWRSSNKTPMTRESIFGKLGSSVKIQGTKATFKKGAAGSVIRIGDIDAKIIRITKQNVRKGKIHYTIEIKPTKIHSKGYGYYVNKEFKRFEIGVPASFAFSRKLPKTTK